MKWLRLWWLLAMSFAAGHVVVESIFRGGDLLTSRFLAELAVVPAAEAAVIGIALSKMRSRRTARPSAG